MIALPPSSRSQVALGLRAAAVVGRFELQVCLQCGAVQYPPREACHRCLSSALDWRLQAGGGDLLSATTLRHSHDEFFRARLPIRLGLVRLDVGPTAVVFLDDDVASAPARVKVAARLDRAGQAVLVASAEVGAGGVTSSRLLREMSCDPRGRRVLVTDAGSAVGVELVRALVEVGAAIVWAGRNAAAVGAVVAEAVGTAGAAVGTEAARAADGSKGPLGSSSQVKSVDLDVTSDESVRAAAVRIASQVDILINTAESLDKVAAGVGVESAHAEMDISHFGLVRLARAFGPLMRATATGAAGGDSNAAEPAVGTPMMAWVNLLSIDALSVAPGRSALSASQAAAYSFAQSLRTELQPAGIRVLNIFPGPIDDERNRELLPPKVAPVALARAIVKALQDGVEDVYPGEVAQNWYTRWYNNLRGSGT